MSESAHLAQARWAKLRVLQEHYVHFEDFLVDGMSELGFETTDIQKEIGQWLEHGPQYLMVQAQRSQAKTTVAALYCVWCLIHSPSHRILVISAGGTQANEISTLIVRIILQMPELECLRPDKMAGDRTSVEAFDVHHTLKGLDKSPSVACVGIESNLQGKRADLLLADDVESGKNSATAVQRAKLAHITKDFTSICTTGRIIWLGTPQTLESIYNSLPARGVVTRIWPGRYPTPEQRAFYGPNLAPSIVRALANEPSLAEGGGLLGDQGQPIDPMILGEEILQKKELDQGEAYFQLQHMLNTTLSDAMRFPLKPEKLVMMSLDGVRAPLSVVRSMTMGLLTDKSVCDFAFKLSIPHDISEETAPFQSIWACVDPAAGGVNADETAYAIAGFLNGTVYLLACGGLPGGYDEEKLEELAKRLAAWKLDGVTIEKNMGYGAFRQVFEPILRKHIKCQIEDELVTGQKERRIINTLAPVMGRGALVIDEDVIEQDRADCQRYSPSMQQSYSLFYQLAKISAAPGALVHDDRADALEAVVRHFQDSIAQDQSKRLEADRRKAHAEMIKDPLKHNRYKTPGQMRYGKAGGTGHSMLRRRR